MDSYFRDVQTFLVETTRFPWKSRDNQAKPVELGFARSVLVCGKVGLLRDSMVCYVVSKFSMNVTLHYITLHYFNSLLSYSQKHEIIEARVKEFI